METEEILTEKFLSMISRYRFVDAAPTVQPLSSSPWAQGQMAKAKRQKPKLILLQSKL